MSTDVLCLKPNPYLLETDSYKKRKSKLAHEYGQGAPCLKCKDDCPGFELHFWRKICRNCRCSKEEHDVKEEEELPGMLRVGKLFDRPLRSLEDELKYSFGTDLQMVYKKDGETEVKKVRFDWIPPGITKRLAAQYMTALSKMNQPIKGSEGAKKRRKQLDKQLPPHDINIEACSNLSELEKKRMEDYIAKLKKDVIGQGEVFLYRAIPYYVEGRDPVPLISEMVSAGMTLGHDAKYSKLLSGSKKNQDGHRKHKRNQSPSIQEKREYRNRPTQPFSYLENRALLDPTYSQACVGAGRRNSRHVKEGDPSLIYHKGIPSHLTGSEHESGYLSLPEELSVSYRENPEYYGHLKRGKRYPKQRGYEDDNRNRRTKSPRNQKERIMAETKGNVRRHPLAGDMMANSESRKHVVYHTGIPHRIYGDHAYDSDPTFTHQARKYREQLDMDSKDEEGRPLDSLGRTRQCYRDPRKNYARKMRGSDSVSSDEYSGEGSGSDGSQDYGIHRSKDPYRAIDGSQTSSDGDPGFWKRRERYRGKDFDRLDRHPYRGDLRHRRASGSEGSSPESHEGKGRRSRDPQNVVAARKEGYRSSYPKGYTGEGHLSSDPGLRGKYGSSSPVDYRAKIHRSRDGQKYREGRYSSGSEFEKDENPKGNRSREETQEESEDSGDQVYRSRVDSDGYPLPPYPEMDDDDDWPETVRAIRVHFCLGCDGILRPGDVAVCARRLGEECFFHPECFVCEACKELLVDLIYFCLDDKVYCGRHYAEAAGVPRCLACDELIWTQQYTLAEQSNWHVNHFCCWACDESLGGKEYLMHELQPYGVNCFSKQYGKQCGTCGEFISADAKRVTLKDTSWHQTEECFRCVICKKSLLGGSLTHRDGNLLCSRECLAKYIQE